MVRLATIFVLLTASLFAQVPTTSAPAPKPTLLTTQQIMVVHDKIIFYPKLTSIPPNQRQEFQRLLQIEKRWVPVFGLEKWKIAVFPVPYEALQNFCPKTCMAGSEWDLDERTAMILILKESDYTTEMKIKLRKNHVSIRADQRNSVLHEILHNVFEHLDEEVAVSILSGLLQR